MTSPGFIGCIEVRPALNDDEQSVLLALLDSDGTLRGTPTGRGDSTVPFARLAWAVCGEGCCLTWNSEEDSKWMHESLRFVVDHLLRRGAKGEGHPKFRGFTFDHVLNGAVVGHTTWERGTRFVAVSDNSVSGGVMSPPCRGSVARPSAKPGKGSGGKRPDNVIVFRPRRA